MSIQEHDLLSVVLHGVRFHRDFAEWADWLEFGAWACDLDLNCRVALYPPTCPVNGNQLDDLHEIKLRRYLMDELKEAFYGSY